MLYQHSLLVDSFPAACFNHAHFVWKKLVLKKPALLLKIFLCLACQTSAQHSLGVERNT